MSIIPDLLDLFPDTVSMQSGTFDGRGTFHPSGEPVTIPAYCHGLTEETKDASGRVVAGAKIRVVLAGAFGASVRHQFVLPDRFRPNTNLRPIAVEQSTDESGPHHETVWF